MDPRDYYKVSYSSRNECKGGVSREILDNETEFNANHFKLFDDFTTDLRISYNPLRNNYHGITRMDSRRCAGDPNDSGVDMENGNPLDGITISNDVDLLENEVMVDPWSSMDSSNSPLTDSGPSVSEECTPSTSSETPRRPLDASSPISDVRRVPNPKDTKKYVSPKTDKTRSRDLTLELETLEPDLGRRTHFLDDDFQSSSKLNIECRIPKPHFLDHSPSPDEFDERSDITNPNFLDDEVDGDDGQSQKKAGALPKRPQNPSTSAYSPHEDRPHRTNYRTTLHYGLESAARSSERDKRASQLYRGTWPGERDVWTGHDSASVRSFSSNGSADGTRPSSNLENKMECVCSLISLLSLSPENNADLSGPLLDMSRSVESCIAMRQAGCIPLLVQLIHSKVSRETRDRAAKALRNIIHTQTDDKAGRREARVWRLLEQVREYCYILEDLVGARKEGKVIIEDDATKHPSQSVAALMKLSFDEEHRHVVCQLGGLQALAALVSGDQAAHGSRTDDNTCLTMRKYAGMTLTNLTFGDGNNKSLLCSFKEFMMALVDQLESPNDDMRQVTAAVLRNLSWRADTNSKLVLREVGAVKGLTKAAMTCQKEATLKSVLSALWNLTAHCSMNKVALCSVDGALGFLVDMLSYNSPTKTLAIVENAGGIMRNVSSHIAVREDYRQILRERNCLSVLLQHLKSPSLTVVSNSCGTLWNLSARCPQDQQFLWEHGAVPMLRSLIHSKHKMIAMGSGAALKNLLNSKPGKTHIISLDTTARSMNLPALPTLGARKQKALEQELDQNLSETCDNIEPATSPTTSNREEKNLFTATERQIAMNLERHRMTSSSPLMGTLTSQISLSHSAHLASYLSCSNTLLKGALVSRSSTGGSAGNVNRSDSKDSVTSTHSDSVFERVMRTGKVPVPTPRSKDLMKNEKGGEAFKTAKQMSKDGGFLRYPLQAPIPPPRSTELRTNYTESGFDVDQDSCDQPVDYSRKYSETKTAEADVEKPKAETKKYGKKESATAYGDYQETDLDQPTDYSLRYAEHQSETGSDSEPVAPSVHEDTIKHFATEGTPYETPVVFSTATSMSDLRLIGKDGKPKTVAGVKENPEVMTHSDEKDTCSIEEPPKHDNDLAASTPQSAAGASEPAEQKRGLFDTKFSSGMISPEKPVNYCDEGTPGYFSRVSSLSSLGEPTEEDCLAKRNAMATINVEPGPAEQATGGTKDKEGCKAVTFAAEGLGSGAGSGGGTPGAPGARYVQETPLMFSRSSSLGSLPECDHQDDQGSVLSEISRLTSGWLSPSEIPDSPGAASPRAPSVALRAALSPPDECARGGSVWSERVSRYHVEHTPAHLSTGTSLSSLTIEHEHALEEEWAARRDEPAPHDGHALHRSETVRPVGISTPTRQEPAKDAAEGADREECRVYCTEDTPAALSKAGSNSNLSALSIDSSPAHAAATPAPPPRRHESSDSSNLSDAADLLEECIQKGIDKVVKIKTAPAPRAASPVAPALAADPRHRSAPACARASTDTEIKRRAAYHRADRSEQESPAPPLPPRPAPAAAPPRPPLPAPAHPATRADVHHHAGRKHESGLPIDSERGSRERAARADSLSSLSADSFGSTDREIFEETVKAGLSSVNPRAAARHALDAPSSAERRARTHRSLDRSDKISHHRRRIKDPEFEINLAAGAYELKSCSEMNRLEESRCRPSHREETGAPGHQARSRSGRWRGDGPASLPLLPPLPAALGEEVPNRSDSLSSLSNDSFGSTDKEVFERCVRMGMPKPNKRKEEERGRGADRPEPREHRRRRGKGALDRMVGEDSKDRAILEEVIARGAGEHKPKNVPAPPAEAAAAGAPARTAPPATGSDATEPPEIFPRTNELPTVDSLNTTLESNDEAEMARSNECLAPASCANTTIESGKEELNRSNESYADVPDGSWSGAESPPRAPRPQGDAARKEDTWNDNTCPDDITFPTISGSVHLVSSIGSEGAEPLPALPDLLETSEAPPAACRRPDLTDKLDGELLSRRRSPPGPGALVPEGAREPSFASLLDEQKFESILSEEIEREAARLAALLRRSHYETETGAAPLASLDLDDVKPPSNLGSLLSLSASVHRDEPSHAAKNSQRTRKRSLPVASMVKKALSNSMHRGSSERLDGEPFSFLEDVNPPSEMERLDMESSLVSVSSLRSEVGEEPPLVFDLSQPVRQFPLCDVFSHLYHDLDDVNPPSLFDEMMESTLELEPSKARQEDGSVTLRAVPEPGCERDSERGSPLPYDASSADSTPKRRRDPNYLTPKEKRHVSKDRYRTYTITDTVTEDDAVSEVHEEILAWREPDAGESGAAPRDRDTGRRVSARQRRLEDRARYQTQTVDVREIAARQPAAAGDSLERRLEHKKTVKQKRTEDADRFRTRTLSEDIPPSPTSVTKDANFENVETTTGYDSLSSEEPSHRLSDGPAPGGGGGRGEGAAHELESSGVRAYTERYSRCLPVTESTAARDMCLLNNLKNIEMTASYRRADRAALAAGSRDPSSGDFGYEGDTNSEDKVRSESDAESPPPKPKIIKPARRHASLDSNDSLDREPDSVKAVRGRKKAAYVSPYRRSAPAPRRAPTAAPPPALSVCRPRPGGPPRGAVPDLARRTPGTPLPLERQGTFTKEESSVPPRDLPVPDKRSTTPRFTKSAAQTKTNTSPSRLPQLARHGRLAPGGAPGAAPGAGARTPDSRVRSSPSSHSLRSAAGAHTGTVTSRSPSAAGPLRRGAAGSGGAQPPRLLRSSTFEGRAAAAPRPAPTPRASQIPAPRARAAPRPPPHKARLPHKPARAPLTA